MKKLVKYELLKDLVLYRAGTIVYHEFDVLPSQYRDGDTYATNGEWYTYPISDMKVNASGYLVELVKWCANSQRTDDHHQEWVKELSE